MHSEADHTLALAAVVPLVQATTGPGSAHGSSHTAGTELSSDRDHRTQRSELCAPELSDLGNNNRLVLGSTYVELKNKVHHETWAIF